MAVAFGQRVLTPRRLWEEVIWGIIVLIPSGFWIGFVVVRLCAKCGTWSSTSYWTSCIQLALGFMLLESLYRSIQCIPFDAHVHSVMDGQHQQYSINNNNNHGTDDGVEISFLTWILRSYGCSCPAHYQMALLLYNQRCTYELLSIRILLLGVGVYLGESYLPICLTGGIACGKSTVGNFLLSMDDDDDAILLREEKRKQQQSNSAKRKSSTNGKRSKHDSRNAESETAVKSNATNGSSSRGFAQRSDESLLDDYSVDFICADSIAHEILLPPELLAQSREDGDDIDDDDTDGVSHQHQQKAYHDGGDEEEPPCYMARPHHSVYYAILSAFEGYDILQDDDDDDDDDDRNGVKSEENLASQVGRAKEDADYDEANSSDDEKNHDANHLHGSKSSTKRQDENSPKQHPNEEDSVTGRGIPKLIDRRKLGSIIFNDRALRKRLNGITHPRILMVLFQKLLWSCFVSPCTVTIVDIPLLFESGMLRYLLSGIIVCVAITDPNVQFQRLHERNPDLSKKECWQRMESQYPLDIKMALSDIVIDNTDCSLGELQEQVRQVKMEIMNRKIGYLGLTMFSFLFYSGALSFGSMLVKNMMGV